MKIICRPAVKADEVQIVGLWKALQVEHAGIDSRFKLAGDAEQRWANDFREWVEAEVRCLVVAEWKGQLVGFASAGLWRPAFVYEQDLECYIDEVYVQPPFRRRGIGTELIESIRKWARTVDVKRLRLGVLAENDAAVRFWERLGARSFTTTMLMETNPGRAISEV